MGLSTVDAFYFVVTTITTVGYGDLSFMEAPAVLKLYGAFLMLCGAALLATLFSIVTDAILGERFRDVLARGCAQSRGHVIVAGLGSIGYRLVKELARNGEAVVAIEKQQAGEFVQPAREQATVVFGNARTAEALRRAGVAGAKALVAATDNDLVNLSAGLAAKHVNPACRVVVRVFESRLAAKMRDSLGLDAVLSVSAAAAPTFVGSALCPGAVQGLLLDDALVVLFRRRQEADGPGRDENEDVLMVRHGSRGRFERLGDGAVPRPGDEVIGCRWHSFRERRAGP
jgi:Trk K+ transport system NAD-binding subunit